MSLAPSFTIFKTTDWGAIRVRDGFELNRPLGIVVHHTADPNRAALTGQAEKDAAFKMARSIQKFHTDPKPQGNGWADTGQNFTVSRGGLVLEGRTNSLLHAQQGFVTRGAHAGTSEGNQLWFGIEVEGNNVDSFMVTEPQWRALVELCAWLCTVGQTQSQNIKGHQEFVATQCPGHLMDRLEQLQAETRERKLQLMKGGA